MRIDHLEQRLQITTPSPESLIKTDWSVNSNVELYVKRDDLIHPIISGNKWRKLKSVLHGAVESQRKHIVSFGGGFSNHLHALGYCCHQLDIKFTSIVRGDYQNNLSPMLQDLITWQSDIQYVDRLTYQKRNDQSHIEKLQTSHPNALIIPEGGSQKSSLTGVAEIITELQNRYDYVLAPVASGGTLAGLISGVSHIHHTFQSKILGIAVLKGENYLEQLVTDLLPKQNPNKNWHINHDYHFGGYAKSDDHLQQFCQHFYQQTKIEIEPVYSGKLFYGIKELLAKQYFPSGSRVLALHTGGIQGAR